MPISSSAESKLLTPWKSQSNSELQETNGRVKMGQELRWATIFYPLKKSN